MSFLGMGLAFAAIGFITANTVTSLLVVLLWRTARQHRRSSGSLFRLRMLPTLVSMTLVAGLLLPAYVVFEPRGTTEKPGPTVVALIVLAAAMVLAGAYRGAMSWLDTWRLERTWRAASRGRIRLGLPVRAYRIPSELPLAALVGVVRPRLFVSGRFFDALSEDERHAVLEHEAGHLRSLDNLKRTAMKLAPDWLALSPVGQEIEAAWAVAAEEEADDHAAGPGRARSLDLAGALLKAVRLTPLRPAPASNFYDGATVSRRVARLLADVPGAVREGRSPVPRYVWALGLVLLAGLFVGPALRTAYDVTEAALRLLR